MDITTVLNDADAISAVVTFCLLGPPLVLMILLAGAIAMAGKD
jgi:hypothetical protein